MAWTLARLRHDNDADVADGDVAERAERDGAAMATRLKALAMDGKCARDARRCDGSMPQFMADEFLLNQFDLDRNRVLSVMRSQVGRNRRPPVSIEQLTETLARKSAPTVRR